MLKAIAGVAAAVVSLASTPAIAGTAASGGTATCTAPIGAERTTFDLSNSKPFPRLRVRKGEVVRVRARHKDFKMDFPMPTSGQRAVCVISTHRGADGTAVTKVLTLHRHKVWLDAPSVSDGHGRASIFEAGLLRIR